VVIIKKSKDVIIDKNIAAIFRTDNLVEYKSPKDYVSMKDFYKVYGYACLYASMVEVPITEITISFVENHEPRKLLAHLEEVRGYRVEEKTPGIYTITGDVFPIQIIDSRRLSPDENFWLKGLTNTLDTPEIQRLIDEGQQRRQDPWILVYLDAIYKANTEKMEEVLKMNRAAPSFVEFLQRLGEERGYNIKWEEKAKREVAKNALAKGFQVEDVAAITGFSPEALMELVQEQPPAAALGI
jgi:hypothetical protein